MFTHRLKHAIPELNLPEGMLMRQINPFAGDHPTDILFCLDENDIKYRRRTTWHLTTYDVEPLPEWPEIRQKMIDEIMKGR